MENRSRDTIAGRATILKNGDIGIPEQFSSTNSIAGRAAIMRNNNLGIPKQPMKTPNQLQGQRDIPNYERQMASGAPIVSNNGNAWAMPMELNLKVTPPPSNPAVERNVEFQSRNRQVSRFEEPNLISKERLKEAIIWSEILGEPLSRRRKRR